MNSFGIVFLITLLGCVVADQPPFPGMHDICEASREPFRQYLECMDSKLPESFKYGMDKVLECLEEPSFVALLDSICEAVNSGISDEEIFEELSNCSPPRLNLPEPSREDMDQVMAAQEKCIFNLMPYIERPME